jgi:hypothetical protein
MKSGFILLSFHHRLSVESSGFPFLAVPVCFYVHYSFPVALLILLRHISLKELFCRFIKVEKIRDQLLECNKETYWVPDYVKVCYGL